jgi:bile acid-coenzyme A ligase
MLPEWVTRTWLELIAPERFQFLYGGSEGVGLSSCTGVEWLEHPGTTGKPLDCDVVILDADRRELSPGEVGEIWMRLHSETEPFRYIGMETPNRSLADTARLGTWGGLTRTATSTSQIGGRT